MNLFSIKYLVINFPLLILSFGNSVSGNCSVYSLIFGLFYTTYLTIFIYVKQKNGYEIPYLRYNPKACFESLISYGYKKTAYLGMVIYICIFYLPVVLYFLLTPLNDWFIFYIGDFIMSIVDEYTLFK